MRRRPYRFRNRYRDHALILRLWLLHLRSAGHVDLDREYRSIMADGRGGGAGMRGY
jgi:hypothetical protein